VSRTAGDDTIGAQFRDLNLEAESHAESIARLLADLDHTAEEFDDLDAQIQRAQESSGGSGAAEVVEDSGGAKGASGTTSQAALTAEADPAARIEHYLDEKRERRGEPS
jgi:ABC-type enterochelin transport system substrate-binding protein